MNLTPASLVPPAAPVRSSITTYREGRVVEVVQKRRQRHRSARLACIAKYGNTCSVCEIDVSAVYGPEAARLIHVHHLDELSVSGERDTDPVRDLRPVCPTSHYFIHQRTPPFSLAEAQALVRARRYSPSPVATDTGGGVL